MVEKDSIGTKQLAVLIVFVTLGDMLLVLPTAIASAAHQDSWISSLSGMVFGLLITGLLFVLGKSIGRDGLMGLNRKLLGRFAGGLVSVVYLLYFLMNTSIMVRESSDFLTTQLFPETPMRAIHAMAIIALMVGVKYGLQTIARTSELFFPIFALLLTALLLMLIPQVETERLQPIMANGISPVVKGTVLASVYPFCELCVILMVMPHVVRQKHLARDYGLAVLLGGIGSFSVILLSILVLGSTMTSHFIYPIYILSGKVSIGHFLERLEALLAVNLVLSTFIKSVLFYYAFVLGMAQLFKLDDYRPLVFPTGMIVFGLAFVISPNVVYFNSVIMTYLADIDVVVGIALPLLLVAVYRMKGKAVGGRPAKGG
ncbi:endospore germination permease [Paenibacillus hodogayensis]|uniref:Endospore germination permease n=1 Tax=Paenibacillus hodogayensis TaxID=279208 RepID=A0ABV5W5B1_9BACL